MRTAVAAVLSTAPAAVLAVVALSASPARADTPHCVSKAEYRQVHAGDTRRQVRRVFDVAGTRRSSASAGGFRTEVRSYPTCAPKSAVSVAYDKNGAAPWRLTAKSAMWS